MGIRFNKIIRKSSKKAYVDPKLVRDAELAREMARNGAYLASHGPIGF